MKILLDMFLCFILSLVFSSNLLYADELKKTQLDQNKFVFRQEQSIQADATAIDYIGNVMLLKPVEVIKDETEDILLNKFEFRHTEMDNDPAYKNNFISKNHDGPKISLSF